MSKFYTYCKARGNKMNLRGYNDGVSFKESIQYSPTLFVEREKTDSDYKVYISNRSCEPIEFDSIRDAKDFVEKYEGVEGFKIHGNTNWTNQYIGYKWPKDVPYDPTKIKSMFLDIETSTEHGFPDVKKANEEILLITIKLKGKTPITFATRPYNGSEKLNTEYRLHTSEESMLRAFITHIKNSPPDVISGWNVEGFDIPYLCTRIFYVLGEEFLKQLSPFGFVDMKEVEHNGRKEARFDIGGIVILDYLALYQKFVLDPRDNYKLDYIAEIEVGEKKLDHSEYKTFKSFYTDGWDTKFVAYNIIDVELVEKIDGKQNLLDLVFSVAYMAKINFIDVLSPIKTWESVIYNHLLAEHTVIPFNSKKISESFEGAYVKDTLSGRYNWVVSFDLTSLYPHLIMLLNCSPDTITGKSRDVNILDLVNKKFDTSDICGSNYALSANGQLFNKAHHGIFPILMKTLFNRRKQVKDEMLALKKEKSSILAELSRRGIKP